MYAREGGEAGRGRHMVDAGEAGSAERDHGVLRSRRNLRSILGCSSWSFLKSIVNGLKPAGLLVF